MSKPASARLIAPLLLALVISAATLTLPFILDQDHGGPTAHGLSVEAAPRHRVTLSKRLIVDPGLGMTVTDGEIGLRALAQPTDSNTDDRRLASGRAELAAKRLLIDLFRDTRRPATRSEEPAQPPSMESVLSRGAFRSLAVERGTIAVRLPGRHRVSIHNAAITLARDSSGATRIVGKGRWRWLDVSIDARLVPAQQTPTGAEKAPATFALSVKSDVFTLAYTGTVSRAQGLKYDGSVNLQVSNPSHFASLISAKTPVLKNAKTASLTASMAWDDERLALSDVELGLGADQAIGALTVTRPSERYAVAGTLDFETLDFARFFAGGHSANADDTKGRLGSHLSSQLWGEWHAWLDRAWRVFRGAETRAADVDLRVSAKDLRIGGIGVGRAAASLLNTDGALRGYVAEFRFAGGEGSGQFSTDFAERESNFEARGKIDRVDLARASAALNLPVLMTGLAEVKFDLASKGTSPRNFLKQLEGTILLSGIDDGTAVAIDLDELVNDETAPLRPLAEVAGQTPVQGLAAEIAFFNGTMYCRAAKATTGDVTWRAEGSVNMLDRVADVTLKRASSVADAPAGGAINADAGDTDGTAADNDALANGRAAPDADVTTWQIVGPVGAPILRRSVTRKRKAVNGPDGPTGSDAG